MTNSIQATTSETEQVQYGFYFDSSKCTGCKTCHVSCKSRGDLPDGIIQRRVYEFVGGAYSENADGSFTNDIHTHYTSIGCNHCTEPACVNICPVGAMHKEADTGLVKTNDEKCIGCNMCAGACPYDAPQLDTERKKMTKCDGCFERIALDRKPICVESCPLHALDFDTMDNLKAKYGDGDTHVTPLPDFSVTKPNLIVKNNRHAGKGGAVINSREV
ncbi:dimethylsulfoxide reductase subunit B [Shewanella abyssi]|uniref:DMSO/selenate family reductase complex B subunit n=1 Tax=Shewanella abyssi TaxID=311789 RepID=UPI00200BF962|nr:DMSO/selenate family reductase complex B subunit [Shewanella abyssi]MCL1048711.1 dimethylsulfoxide reductase subunit B [Shewanella abyssi]